MDSPPREPRSRRPFAFFALVFVLSIPFLIVGAVTRLELLPGIPAAALMIVAPLGAAALLVSQEQGRGGLVGLLKRTLDIRTIPAAWFATALLLMPCLAVVSYGLMRLMQVPLPDTHVSPSGAAGLFLAFLVAALTEEVGWSGYATDPLQDRWGALQAAVIIGAVWAVWHIVPLIQAHRAAGWIAWWGLGTIGHRVLIVWLYDNAGRSIVAAALYHAMSNLCWQLFPDRGSHYDPRLTTLLIATAAAVVVFRWGPRTLRGRSLPSSWATYAGRRP